MTAEGIPGLTDSANVIPIRKGLYPGLDIEAQEQVRRARLVLETTEAFIATDGQTLPDHPEITMIQARDGLSAARKQLPVYSLAVVHNERKQRRDAWHRMKVRLALAKARLDYVSAQENYSRWIGGAKPADGARCEALREYREIVRQLILTPAPTKADLATKRRHGDYELSGNADLKAAYDRDAARFAD